MELRKIWNILVRRWWLVLIPPLVVGVISARSWRSLISPPVSYSTVVSFTVGQYPQGSPAGYDPRYYSWLTSEYIAKGLEEWVRGQGFAQKVSADLAARHNLSVAPDRIQGAVVSDSARSVLVLYLNWPDASELAAVADSAVQVLTTSNADAFPQFGQGGAIVTALNTPGVAANAPSLRDRLDLPLRVALALIAGLALAFFVEYLDPTLRTRAELEAAGLEVIAEIPRRRSWRLSARAGAADRPPAGQR